MRLTDFIDANVEPILAEWEVFARSIWPNTAKESVIDPATLRDDAEDILRATVSDMRSDQTAQQQSEKSKGKGDAADRSARVMKHRSRTVQAGLVRDSSFGQWLRNIGRFEPAYCGCGGKAVRSPIFTTLTT